MSEFGRVTVGNSPSMSMLLAEKKEKYMKQSLTLCSWLTLVCQARPGPVFSFIQRAKNVILGLVHHHSLQGRLSPGPQITDVLESPTPYSVLYT